jgi:hypothetical protein
MAGEPLPGEKLPERAIPRDGGDSAPRQEKRRARIFRRVFVPFSIAWISLPLATGLVLWWLLPDSGLEPLPVFLALVLVALLGVALTAWLASRIAMAIA